MLGTEWGGARVRDVLEAAHVELSPSARFVMVHCVTEFTTNLPIEALLADDTMLVWEWNGLPLTVPHGGPLRLLVPSLYAWKDAKWVSGFEFLAEDQAGVLGIAWLSYAWGPMEGRAIRLRTVPVT